VKDSISDSQEYIIGLNEAYSSLLKLSNQYCQYISVHDIRSCVFAILMVVAADTSKSSVLERFSIVESFPYIDIKDCELSEASTGAIRAWNDLVFYFPKSQRAVNKLVFDSQTFLTQRKNYPPSSQQQEFTNFNKEAMKKLLITFSILQERCQRIENSMKEYALWLKKSQVFEQISQASAVLNSCGAFGIDNLLKIFCISPINKSHSP
jgi:hypothetical protein